MLKRLLGAMACVILLTSCHDGEENKNIRAIQYVEVSEASSGQVRRISGIVQTSQKADLSFEISGNVISVDVNLGSHVKMGDLLARLDPKPYQLNVNAMQAELTKAKALLADKQSDYQAKAKLYEKHYVSKSVLDTAKADSEAATQNVESAIAKLALAERELKNTELKAPFDGEIAKRMVDPATNVAVGQPVFQLLGKGGLEVEAAIPESLRREISIGMPVVIVFPSLNGEKANGELSEISASANELNAFPIKVKTEPAPGVYPGLTAELIFNYQHGSGALIFLIPATALLPGEDAHAAYVYVYDPKTSTVHKKAVVAKQMQENQVEIVSGLSLGDIVATAGVHFLYDGQKVKLYKEY